MQGRGVVIFLAVVVAQGCAGTVHSTLPDGSVRRVAILAPHVESVAPVDRTRLESVLLERFDVAGGLDPGVGAVAEPEVPDCYERVACIRDAAETSGAELAVATTIVTLGDTAMLRLRFVDVGNEGSERTRQRVVSPADESSIEAALASIADELASPYRPREEIPLRRRRWRWLGPLLGVAAASAIATPIAVVRMRPPDPDVVITPP